MPRLNSPLEGVGRFFRGRLSATFLIMLGSRFFGIIRELIVSVAFGFSLITDLFYQATFALTALLTVTNGPFTTAFAARLNQIPDASRGGHVRYYSRLASKIGALLALLYMIAAALLFVMPELTASEGWVGALTLAPCAAQLAVIGFTGAVANALGEIAKGAKLMFVLNAAFVACVSVCWMAHVPLKSWTLPLCYTCGGLAAYVWSRSMLSGFYAAGASNGSDDIRPLPGLTTSFLYAGSETLVFILTQFLVVSLATYAGPGWVSGASLAQRLCFSVNGLIISPFASLLMIDVMQAKANARTFGRGLLICGLGLLALAIVFAFGVPAALHAFGNKLHGSTPIILGEVLPAYALWMLPMGMNVVVCRIMFGLKLERFYTISTISCYIVANVVRCLVEYGTGNFALAIGAGAVVEVGCVAMLAIATLRHMSKGSKLAWMSASV